jgi:hypothetical protein
MLPGEHAVDQVEVVVREHPEVGITIEDELAVGVCAVYLPGGSDHRRRDIDAVAVVEVGRQRACQPADTAAEVERARFTG